ncbi:hypothetical protein C8J25_101715 [Sphingomonas faeni]|uniref:Uncharacterized protein n=1 Tax=Sphingomonas faeni TaxID=185950 RepID=A0A2T5UCG8_9SPHN|nr:hypothetical protein [Sphingomonas faeni]PTW49209.1 hypothetical protein C8J25_101715 [Sphingomonas faeni]
MFKGLNRYIVVAFLLLEAILFALFLYDSGSLSGTSNEQARHFGQHYAAQAQLQVKRTCARSNLPADCVLPILQSTREDQRAESNLNWQRQAARWSWWTLVIALGQTLVGAIGLVALFRSMRQTELALGAATDANLIARESLYSENRPWLHVEAVTFEHMTSTMGQGRSMLAVFTVKVTNIGTTAAINVSARAGLAPRPQDAIERFSGSMGGVGLATVLPSGHESADLFEVTTIDEAIDEASGSCWLAVEVGYSGPGGANRHVIKEIWIVASSIHKGTPTTLGRTALESNQVIVPTTKLGITVEMT